MPGAISGQIVSIAAEKGTIQTRRGSVSFSLENDSLQSSDLRDEYRVGDDVAFFVNNNRLTNPDSNQAHIVCPEKRLKEGFGVVERVNQKYATGRNDAGDEVFFSVGRLSKILPATEDRDLRDVVRPGDRFRYRAMPPKKGDILRACNVVLSSNRAYFKNWDARRVLDRSREHKDRNRTDEHRSRSPHRRREHSENDGDRSSRHRSRRDEYDSHHRRVSPGHRSVKRELPDDEDWEQLTNQNAHPVHRHREHSATKRHRRASSMDDSEEQQWAQIDLQSLMENAYIRAHNLLSQSSCDNDDTAADETSMIKLEKCAETQTDPFPARMLAQMLLADKALVQLLTKERPDILATAIDAVNLGLSEWK